MKTLLNPGNAAFHDALNAAATAVAHLDTAGATVRDIDIRGGRPVLRVDRPPAFVRGVATVTCRQGSVRSRLMAAPWLGCQIEWDERDQLPARGCA